MLEPRGSAPRQARPLPWALLLAAVMVALLTPLASPGLTRTADETSFRAVRDPGLAPVRRGEHPEPDGVEAPFPVRLDGKAVGLRLTAFPVLPGQGVEMAVTEASGITFTYQAGSIRLGAEGRWRWSAPEAPGAYALRLSTDAGVVDLTALVLHPRTQVRGGVLEGYRIGEYRAAPLRGDPAYLPPEGFVEVVGAEADLLVSPRLTLGQFLCKQPGDPRFVALSVPLLVKLEAILDRVARAGHDPASLVVMSGFRTPAYNRAIGNTTDYSRHLWGDAADIYLDGDGDGDMDDLDGNGRVDTEDARVLAGWVEEVARADGIRPGGLAVYRRNAAHGPFVHVDARGTRARW